MTEQTQEQVQEDLAPITVDEKIKELELEITYRISVWAKTTKVGTSQEKYRKKRMQIMKAILADYKAYKETLAKYHNLRNDVLTKDQRNGV